MRRKKNIRKHSQPAGEQDLGARAPSAGLDSFERDLLRAARQARRIVRAAQAPRRRTFHLRYALACGLLVLTLVSAALVLCPQLCGQHIRESSRGVLLSAASGRAIPGAELYLAADHQTGTRLSWLTLAPRAANASVLRLLDITDALGTFDARLLDEISDQDCFVAIGNHLFDLSTLPKALTPSGVTQITLPELGQSNLLQFPVELAPGQTSELSEELSLTLDSAADRPWTGQVLHDLNWPAVFNFGRVVDGIYSVEGPATKHLRLTVKVPQPRLDFYSGKAEALELITRSQRYADDKLQGSRRGYHQGWYLAARPPYADQVGINTTVATQTQGCSIAWPVETGQPYALLLPPTADGEILPCTAITFTAGCEISRIEKLPHVGLARRQMSAYNVYYQSSASATPEKRTVQPVHPRLEFCLRERHLMPDGVTFYPDTVLQEGQSRVSGTLTVERNDFTLQQPASYGPLEASLPPVSGSYKLIGRKAWFSNELRLEVRGPRGLLKQAPQWDIGADGTFETSGSRVYVAARERTLKVEVLLRERSGADIMLSGSFANPLRLSREPRAEWTDAPIINAVDQAPRAESSVCAMTTEATTGPVAGRSTRGGSAGPHLLLRPAPEVLGQPLRELRLHIYGSAISGDYRNVALVPFIQPVKIGAVQAGHYEVETFAPPTNLSSVPQIWGLGNLSYTVDCALNEHNSGGQARDYLLTDLIRGSTFERWGLQTELGLDLDSLPDETTLVAKLLAFKNSPSYAWRNISGQDEHVQWTVPMHGARIAAGEGWLVGLTIENKGLLLNAIWELHAGGASPACVELEYEDGQVCTTYFDYTKLQ